MPFIALSDVPEREPVAGFRVRFVHGERMTLSYWTIASGAELPEHSHPHEQATTIVSGSFVMTVEGQERTIAPGEVVIIPSGARHKGRAVTDCYIVDCFSPVRQDYR